VRMKGGRSPVAHICKRPGKRQKVKIPGKRKTKTDGQPDYVGNRVGSWLGQKERIR
jgi:hypothetical protein